MPNITLALDEELLGKARVYAEKKGTTVNALVRTLLGETIDQDERRESARRKLLELSEQSTARLGPEYKWNRDEIYEDRVLPRHQRPDLRSINED
jgi:hypothetical protein